MNATAEWVESSSGLLLPAAERSRRTNGLPIGIDLFAGAGGFSLGFHQAGYHVVAAVDNDPVAAITYMTNLGAYPSEFHRVSEADDRALEKALQSEMFGSTRKRRSGLHVAKDVASSKWGLTEFRSGSGWLSHFGCDDEEHQGIGYDGEYHEYLAEINRAPAHPYGCEHFWLGDVRQISGADILDALGLERGEVDVVFGGPPCQGFSHVGKRNVMDPRNSLVFEFARLVCEINPKAMAMENVPGIASMLTEDGLPVIDALCMILEEGGFAGYDALRKSITASAGLGVALKSKPRPKGRRAPKPPKNDEPEQTALEVSA